MTTSYIAWLSGGRLGRGSLNLTPDDGVVDSILRGLRRWVSATGPAGTLIFADTTGIHCGGRCKSGVRDLISVHYNQPKA